MRSRCRFRVAATIEHRAAVRAAGGLRLAKERLEQFDAVLLLEGAARWPRLLAAALNWSRTPSIPHLRRSARPATGGDASADREAALLARHNRLDAQLYEYARRIERADAAFHLTARPSRRCRA